MHGLEVEYYGKINFVYLDIDDPANDEFKRQLNFRVQPHIVLLDPEGQVVNQWVGRIGREDLTTVFDSYVK